MNWCSWGISPSPHCTVSQMAEAVGSTSIRHFRVGSMSGRRRSGGLCYVGSGCTYVFLYLYMVYVYVMQYLVCMKLNTRPHKFIHEYISHTSQIPIIHHLCPCQPRLFKKQTTSPHIKVLYVLYMAPHLKNLLCTPGVFMPHVLCTDILISLGSLLLTKFLLIWVEEVVKDCW